ncbi:MAG: shikimate dehydrogenase [Christensenellaceae bacterium]
MQKEFCVIGKPIAHSLSPLIHNLLYQRYSITDCHYKACEVDFQTLPLFMEQINTKKIYGFNVTMPLKDAILPYLSHIDTSVIGGVNTVVVKKDGLYGYSTDAQGFYAGMQNIGIGYQNTHVVLIGAGSVSKLLLQDALLKKASSVTVLNRTLYNAQKLVTGTSAKADILENITAYMPQCDLLIHTTPLGMLGTDANFESLDFIEKLPKSAVVCDLIYRPAQTALLKKAESCNLVIQNGLDMLIWQAFFAFEKFFDILPTFSDYQWICSQIKY